MTIEIEMGVGHYENFPVASWLCPPALRRPITAIYHYARTADDIADEGEAPPAARLSDLDQYRHELRRALSGGTPQRWPQVLGNVASAVRTHGLPVQLLEDLLDAFAQDVVKHEYADRTELLDYCRRSANPVGRLLLHLWGIADPAFLAQSDDICTSLQLINFWQDLSVDLPRGRIYLPLADCARFGVDAAMLRRRVDGPAVRALVAEACEWAGSLMHRGAPLARRVPGRAGWELRLVVQGGLRVLQKIRQMDHGTLLARPRLRAADLVPMLWRAARA